MDADNQYRAETREEKQQLLRNMMAMPESPYADVNAARAEQILKLKKEVGWNHVEYDLLKREHELKEWLDKMGPVYNATGAHLRVAEKGVELVMIQKQIKDQIRVNAHMEATTKKLAKMKAKRKGVIQLQNPEELFAVLGDDHE